MDKNSQNLMLLQIILGILNIGILVLILYLIARILKPIFALTQATLEVEKGNLDVSIKVKVTTNFLFLMNLSIPWWVL
ncbi:MAG: hypothetical protein M3044_08300 [Thermoproteota archaeon]|nr:hypothetical protein [Thermoproteota archaeon]